MMNKANVKDGEIKELEILEFKAGGNSYGVDINDIKEILPYNQEPTPIPNSHPDIEGMIMPRDFIIPIINLVQSLGLEYVASMREEMLIVTGIHDLNIGFHVDKVQGIHRVMSTEIKKPGKNVTTKLKDVIIGTFERKDTMIEILDFRNIISAINPNVLN